MNFSKHAMQGFLVPLAAIIVVGLGVLALAITRITSQSNSSSILEGLSTQAFYAAESGAQYGMNQLLFTASSRAVADTNCDGIGTTLNYSVTGLSTCSAVVSCSRTIDAGDTTSFYQILSAGFCGSGDFLTERNVQVSAYME